jgi:hypothetical protein
VRYYNGQIEAERPTTPDEATLEAAEPNYETFSGTYSYKRFPVEAKRLSASVVIKPASKRMKAIRKLANNDQAIDALFANTRVA